MNKRTPSTEFADAIGRKAIADAVGVGVTAVSNAVVREAFPSSWFLACQKLASLKKVPFPAALFQQRGVDIPQSVNSIAADQVSAKQKREPGKRRVGA